MEKTKKAGIIAATTITAAGAALAITGMQTQAAELDNQSDKEPTLQQQTEEAEALSVKDAEEKADAAKTVMQEAQQTAQTAEEEWKQASEDLEAADGALQDAVEDAKAAFTETVREAAAEEAEAKEHLQQAEANVTEAEEAVKTLREEEAKVASAAEEASVQLEEAKSASPVTEEELSAKQAELDAAKEELDQKEAEADAADHEATEAAQQLEEDYASLAETEAQITEQKATAEDAEAALAQAETAVREAETVYREAKEAADGTDVTQTEEYQKAEEAEDAADRAMEAQGQSFSQMLKAETAVREAEETVKAAEKAVSKAEDAVTKKQAEADAASDAVTKAGLEKDAKAKEAAAAKAQAETAKEARTAAEQKAADAKQKAETVKQDKADADAKVKTAQTALDAAKENASKDLAAEVKELKTQEAADQAAYESAKKAAEEASVRYDQGSLGFIEWMLAKEGLTAEQKNDLNDAKAALLAATEEDYSRFGVTPNMPEYRNNKVVYIGDAKDATNLEYMKKSIGIMKDINVLRTTDENYVGSLKRNTAQTNFYHMSIAQICAMRGAGVFGHSETPDGCENLAWGYDNPNDGWYTKEKVIFDRLKKELGITTLDRNGLLRINQTAKERGLVIGHYTNLMYAEDQIMGVGYTGYSNTSEYTASSYRTGLKLGSGKERAGYSIEEFEALFLEYYRSVDSKTCKEQMASAEAKWNDTTAKRKALEGRLDAAVADKVKTETAQLNAAKEQAKTAAGKLEEADRAAATAQQRVAEAQKAETDAKSRLQTAETALKRAEDVLGQKKAAEENSKKELDAAKQAAENAKAALKQAKAEKEQADQTLKERQAELKEKETRVFHAQTAYRDAKKALDEVMAQDPVGRLLTKVEEAKAARDAAMREKQKAEAALLETESKRQSLQEKVKNAEADLKALRDQASDALGAEFLAMAKVGSLETEWKALKQAYAPVEETRAEKAEAEAVAAAAKARLETAEAALKEAEAEHAKAVRNYQAASESLRKAQALPEARTDMPLFTEEAFLPLNEEILTMRNAEAKHVAAKALAEQKAAELKAAQGAYQDAKTEYTLAQADLILAQVREERERQAIRPVFEDPKPMTKETDGKEKTVTETQARPKTVTDRRPGVHISAAPKTGEAEQDRVPADLAGLLAAAGSILALGMAGRKRDEQDQ